jgi:elongation factor G
LSAKENMGVIDLLSFVNGVVPSPLEAEPMKSIDGDSIGADINGKQSLFLFKISSEPHLGEVSFFRVISGIINEGNDVINLRKSSKERITQLYVMAGNNRTKIESIVAGDIGATIKLKENRVGDSLNSKDNDLEVAKINYPEPKYRTAINAANSSWNAHIFLMLS